jgi:hypothetical protein
MMVSPQFFDLVNYSFCSAVSQFLGPEKAVELFRYMGRTHYEELKKRNLIKSDGKPMEVLESIARYLERSGYMERIEIQRLSENESIVDMYGVSVLESSVRLTQENKQPSHIMTNTMFAALEELGYDAELIDLLFETDKNHVREKWILRKK